jgi:hypothetical protein
MRQLLVTLVFLVGLSTGPVQAGWFSDEKPPAGAKPLSEIIKAVEDQALGVVTEVEFEDGLWKLEVHKPDGKEMDLRVNPISGQIEDRR